eukprot:XP_014783920.1 PREDICTED: uncharacterized protein LOC106879032 [Octopus bimaculoides]
MTARLRRSGKEKFWLKPGDQEKPKIIKLSTKPLSSTKIDILSKGLKFTPTPRRVNQNEVKDSIIEFSKKLRLTEALTYYNTEDDSLVKNKSEHISHKGRNKKFDEFCNHIENFSYHTIHKQTINSNFSTTQWKGLTELQNNEDITIKEADKGNAVVVMDTLYYKNLVISMLDDYQHYEKITKK